MNFARPYILIIGLAILLLVVSAACVFIGPTHSLDTQILMEIRLPRVILGVLIGISLSSAGAIFQGLFRNPLADPYILGTSSGAAVGALVALQVRYWIPGWFSHSAFLFYLLVFLGSFLATLTSYLIARSEQRVPIVNLLLSGVIVSTFCAALILLFFTLQHRDSFSMFFFMMGSLIEGDWKLISISSTVILAGTCMSLLFARDLNILSLGDEKAMHLGIQAEKLKLILFALASLIVSAAVAVSGTIGFLGLIVPHISRLVVGPNHKFMIPASALLGGILLVVTDAIARTIANPIEIPVGIITAMMGAPFFLWLLKRKRKFQYF